MFALIIIAQLSKPSGVINTHWYDETLRFHLTVELLEAIT